jgi:hypothetical protein
VEEIYFSTLNFPNLSKENNGKNNLKLENRRNIFGKTRLRTHPLIPSVEGDFFICFVP